MTGFKAGDVILIPFPFTDLSTVKQRPALVISSDLFNQRGLDVIVSAITSHIPKEIPAADYLLETSDLKLAGLPKTSIVKLGKIVTIDQRLIRKKLGSLPPQTLQRIFSKLGQVIGG